MTKRNINSADQVINARIAKLEDAMVVHLTESGEIRSDIKWIKKAFFVVVGIGSTFCSGVLIMLFKLLLHSVGQ